MRSKNILQFPVPPKAKHSLLKPLIEFFPTPQGRTFSWWTMSALSVGALTLTFLPQSIFFDEYRESFLDPAKSATTPEDVNDELKERVRVASKKLSLNDNQVNLARAMTVAGHDIKEYGYLSSRYGGWIGFPANYFYKTAHDINKEELFANNELIKHDHSSSQLLQDSLVLNESEQIFAICRSLLELKSYRLYITTFIAASSVIFTYTLGQFLNIKFNMFKRPNYVRYAAYPIVVLIGYGVFGAINDLYTFQREKRIDKKLVRLGPEMVDAGVRFYEKLINKETAIREMSGKQHFGMIRWLGLRTTPLEARKEFFQSNLNAFAEEQEKSTP